MGKLIQKSALIVIVICTSLSQLPAQTTVTYRAPVEETDQRYKYEQALLTLLLEKSSDEYGDYTLSESPAMNLERALQELRLNRIENLIIQTSATDPLLDEFAYLPVPIMRGVSGYRVFFTNPKIAEELESVSTLEELQKYTIGQGSGWADNAILRHNGFTVVENSSFSALFKMVAVNRFNLFSRGAHEVKEELESRSDIANLVLDNSICIYYPLPRFLFTNKANTELIERLTYGFEIALDDGSFIDLWKEHIYDSVSFLNLQNRTIFELENPSISTLNLDEMNHLIYKPLEN